MILPLVGPDSCTPEWYAIRNSIIGSSEAAAACGLSEYKTPLELYLEKIGQVEPFAGNEHTRRGKRYEPLIAEDWQEMTGRALAKYPCPMYLHPTLEGIAATPDGQISETEGLEIKCPSPRAKDKFGEEGTDEIPNEWKLQAQQQMGVMGWERVHFAVKVFDRPQLYVVERNERLIDAMFQMELRLLERIKNRLPPEPTWGHDTTLDLVYKLNTAVNEDRIMLNDEEVALWEEYETLGRKIALHEIRRKEIKSRVLWGIGESGGGILPDGRMIRRKWVQREGYYVNPSSYIDTRTVKADKGRIVERKQKEVAE